LQEPAQPLFIYGAPAAGKLTVAREISALTGLLLYHNHLVVDAVASDFPFGTAPFIRLREMMWLEVFRETASQRRSLLFTFALERSVMPAFVDRVREIVEPNLMLRLVRLTVPPQDQLARIANPDRAARGKLVSSELLKQLSQQFAECEAEMPSPEISLDTARLSAVPTDGPAQISRNKNCRYHATGTGERHDPAD
jgi:hypothetical protein